MLSGAAEYLSVNRRLSRHYILTDVSCCSCLSVWMLQYWSRSRFLYYGDDGVDSFTDGQLSAQPLPSSFDPNRYTLGMTGTSRHPSVIWEPAKQQNAGRWKKKNFTAPKTNSLKIRILSMPQAWPEKNALSFLFTIYKTFNQTGNILPLKILETERWRSEDF